MKTTTLAPQPEQSAGVTPNMTVTQTAEQADVSATPASTPSWFTEADTVELLLADNTTAAESPSLLDKIEPELRRAIRPHIRDSATTRLVRRWLWNVFLFAFLLLFLDASFLVAPLPLLALHDHPVPGTLARQAALRDTFNTLLILVAVFGTAALLKMESFYAARRRLLREGTPGIALVTGHRENDGLYFLTYEFAFSEYKVYVDEVRVSESQFRRYPVGAPLTVLFPSGESWASLPYISVTQAEIEGAASRDEEAVL